MKTTQPGQRATLRNKILHLLSDGKQWHIKDIVEAVDWPMTTNISKTLNEIKEHLVIKQDPRRLHKESFDNCRKGTLWKLTTKNND
jgi:hypothetical protein